MVAESDLPRPEFRRSARSRPKHSHGCAGLDVFGPDFLCRIFRRGVNTSEGRLKRHAGLKGTNSGDLTGSSGRNRPGCGPPTAYVTADPQRHRSNWPSRRLQEHVDVVVLISPPSRRCTAFGLGSEEPGRLCEGRGWRSCRKSIPIQGGCTVCSSIDAGCRLCRKTPDPARVNVGCRRNICASPPRTKLSTLTFTATSDSQSASYYCRGSDHQLAAKRAPMFQHAQVGLGRLPSPPTLSKPPSPSPASRDGVGRPRWAPSVQLVAVRYSPKRFVSPTRGVQARVVENVEPCLRAAAHVKHKLPGQIPSRG